MKSFCKLLAPAGVCAAALFTLVPLEAQVFTFTKEQMLKYTAKNPFERFEDDLRIMRLAIAPGSFPS